MLGSGFDQYKNFYMICKGIAMSRGWRGPPWGIGDLSEWELRLKRMIDSEERLVTVSGREVGPRVEAGEPFSREIVPRSIFARLVRIAVSFFSCGEDFFPGRMRLATRCLWCLECGGSPPPS